MSWFKTINYINANYCFKSINYNVPILVVINEKICYSVA